MRLEHERTGADQAGGELGLILHRLQPLRRRHEADLGGQQVGERRPRDGLVGIPVAPGRQLEGQVVDLLDVELGVGALGDVEQRRPGEEARRVLLQVVDRRVGVERRAVVELDALAQLDGPHREIVVGRHALGEEGLPPELVVTRRQRVVEWRRRACSSTSRTARWRGSTALPTSASPPKRSVPPYTPLGVVCRRGGLPGGGCRFRGVPRGRGGARTDRTLRRGQPVPVVAVVWCHPRRRRRHPSCRCRPRR